jgi:hypothetical protein
LTYRVSYLGTAKLRLNNNSYTDQNIATDIRPSYLYESGTTYNQTTWNVTAPESVLPIGNLTGQIDQAGKDLFEATYPADGYTWYDGWAQDANNQTVSRHGNQKTGQSGYTNSMVTNLSTGVLTTTRTDYTSAEKSLYEEQTYGWRCQVGNGQIRPQETAIIYMYQLSPIGASSITHTETQVRQASSSTTTTTEQLQHPFWTAITGARSALTRHYGGARAIGNNKTIQVVTKQDTTGSYTFLQKMDVNDTGYDWSLKDTYAQYVYYKVSLTNKPTYTVP